MRKSYKRKRRSCALCKPHKAGWDKRWKAREAIIRKAMERECLHDLAVVAERRDESSISDEEMKRRLVRYRREVYHKL